MAASGRAMITGTSARIRSVAVLLSIAVGLAGLGERPADAAPSRATVVKCRSANPTCWPVAFAFTPNGRRIFYVERFTGQIRVFNRKKKRDRRWARIKGVATSGEQGLLGIALDPRWPKKKFVYVYFTNKDPLQNKEWLRWT